MANESDLVDGIIIGTAISGDKEASERRGLKFALLVGAIQGAAIGVGVALGNVAGALIVGIIEGVAGIFDN